MRVFKFGGASVKNAEAVTNLKNILLQQNEGPLLVVISAMDKTTNHLENVVDAFQTKIAWQEKLEAVFAFHFNILNQLIPEGGDETIEVLEKIKHYAHTFLSQDEGSDKDFIYDQIVSIGEIISTKIIHAFLQNQGLKVQWVDARKLVQTNNDYRNAKVNWDVTVEKVNEMWLNRDQDIIITQGFIGGGEHNRMTTLGREGSDYSAAIFAFALGAASVTIWKDVPGMLNADPKFFSNTTLLPNISYKEAIELSYYGASVIHPKTIKPLENKNIPLYVKSFLDPEAPGSVINQNDSEDGKVPSYIFKTNQVLISISTRDFSFMVEEHISDLFNRFAQHKVHIQTMQNSAISFSVSVTNNTAQLSALLNDLKADYKVLYNEGLELMTIRHYQPKVVEELIAGREVLLEQKTRQTMRVLMRGVLRE